MTECMLVILSYAPVHYRERQNSPTLLSPAMKQRIRFHAEASTTKQTVKEQRNYFLLRIQFQILIITI